MFLETEARLSKISHTVEGHEDCSIGPKTATRQQRHHPTGYAIVKRQGKADYLIVYLDKYGNLNYVKRIAEKDVLPVYDTFIRLKVHFKTGKKKYTVLGTMANGRKRTMGIFIIHDRVEVDKNLDAVPHHLSGDCTNNNPDHVVGVVGDIHGSFHGSLGRESNEQDIRRVATAVGNEQMRTYYCSENGHDNYRPRTFAECEAKNAQDYFSGMSERDFDDMMNAIRQEICNCNK